MNGDDVLDIRYAKILDVPNLKSWFQKPEVLYWTAMSDLKEIEIEVSHWMRFFRYNASLTATMHGVPCAMATLFLLPYKKVSHHCFFKLCIDPKYRRLGVENALIKNIKHLAKTQFYLESVTVEVFAGDPLLPFLIQNDFQEFARQERYVKNGTTYQARILLEAQLKEGIS